MAETINRVESENKTNNETVADAKEKTTSSPSEKHDAATSDDKIAKIALSEDERFFLIQFPENIGILKASGWITEVVLPYLRNHYNKKAVEQMKKSGLIKPNATPPGFRGFNPLKWRK